MENIDEKSMYTGLITLAIIDINGYLSVIDNVEEQLKEPKEIISLVLLKKKVEEVHIKVIEKMYKDLSKIYIRLEILKNKIIKDEKRIKPYFKQFDEHKTKYEQKKVDLMKKIKKYITNVNTLMLKAGIYLEEHSDELEQYNLKNSLGVN